MKLIICLSVIVQGIAYNTPKYINEMARTNYKLVPYFAKSYIKKHKLTYEQREDMIQEGYVGFMYACRSFNESKGLKISCLLYTSPSPRDRQKCRMPSSA